VAADALWLNHIMRGGSEEMAHDVDLAVDHLNELAASLPSPLLDAAVLDLESVPMLLTVADPSFVPDSLMHPNSVSLT